MAFFGIRGGGSDVATYLTTYSVSMNTIRIVSKIIPLANTLSLSMINFLNLPNGVTLTGITRDGDMVCSISFTASGDVDFPDTLKFKIDPSFFNDIYFNALVSENSTKLSAHSEMEVHQGDVLGQGKTKTNDEWAIGIWCDNINGGIGYYGPLLIGLTQSSVQYGTGAAIATVVYNDTTYYANTGYWTGGSSAKPSDSTLVYSADNLYAMGQVKKSYSVADLAYDALYYYFNNHAYSDVEYIKSDGSAWINAGLRFTTDTKFEIKGRWTTTSLSSEFFFGIWQGLKESELGYENGSLVYLMGGTGKYQSFTPDTNSHVISSDANGIYVDGVSVGTPTWANISTGYDIPIFARSVTGTIRSNEITSHFEFEYCKIWQNNVLVRDFVPCMDENNEAGFYEKVQGVFYKNAGSGSLIAGSPI